MPITIEQKRWIRHLLAQLPQHADQQIARVVLDTNVLLDLMHWNDPHVQKLKEALQQRKIVLLWSEDDVDEIVDVLQRSHFGWTDAQIRQRLPVWLQYGITIPQTKIEQTRLQLKIRCKDPLDQKFIEACVAGQAHYLFTKDKLVLKSLRKLSRFGLLGGLPQNTPTQWLVPRTHYPLLHM